MSSNSSGNQAKFTQKEIETKLKTTFPQLSDANITILGYYLYKYPKKWRQEEEHFQEEVNKLMPEAFAHNMMPSNVLFGAIIVIIIIFLAGLLWWIISLFMRKNHKNVLNDPNVVNPVFI